ncbi:AI-2E family transporter YdiK [Roseateles oligotrophus]|uniref:AI-2E family transporter YdiK n=1 Tax=Roseateles oligotrophus TaxID=1769250 RepID=A0ABT2YC70_9BURK|nr:AI-2E family transporter YdiK [Roseateles oligotrophus]MCV2367631.1 AI-2E family transporter YdiK [Roseateles oligotrophus]
MTTAKPELTRTMLTVLSIALLMFTSLWILSPFIGSLIWATMIVVATWPMMRALQRRLWGRRSLASLVMVLLLLLVLFVPLTIALTTVAAHADQVVTLISSLSVADLPQAPDWLASVPLVGESLTVVWHRITVDGIAPLVALAKPYIGVSVKWTAAQAGNLGLIGLQFLLTVALAGILYNNGETAARTVRGFGRRLAGEQGDEMMTLAGQAIRGVAMGIVVTALVQSVLGGLGLWVAGVPVAGLLTAVMLMLCLAQIGVLPVLVPAVAWLYWGGDNVWGTLLLLWTMVVGTMDNFLRPWLIKKGADLPLLLIFAGVIGGLFAFGLVGLFIGPVVLAVTYTLLDSWIGDARPAADINASGS